MASVIALFDQWISLPDDQYTALDKDYGFFTRDDGAPMLVRRLSVNLPGQHAELLSQPALEKYLTTLVFRSADLPDGALKEVLKRQNRQCRRDLRAWKMFNQYMEENS